MDERQFRSAMGNFATGITIVTTDLGEKVHGMTANAFMSVSLNPPLILVSVDQNGSMHEKLKQSGRFAVSILSKDQQAISMHYAKQRELPNIDEHFEKKDGHTVIKNALATMTCRLYEARPAGDHTLFIGEIEELTSSSGIPLTYYQGKYGYLDRTIETEDQT